MTEYWIGQDDERYGPYTEADLRAWLTNGEIDYGAFVWHEGMTEWALVSALFPRPDSPPPPPPPPRVKPVSADQDGVSVEERGMATMEQPKPDQSQSPPASAAPFGLRQGMALVEIGTDLREVARGKYVVVPPKPHSAFKSYVVKVAPVAGLAWIRANGEKVETNVYGNDLKLAFRSLKTKLEATYGSCKDVDGLSHGSIWDEPKDWMMGLIKKERVLCATWSREAGSTLPDDLKSIVLAAVALDSESGNIALEYNFLNGLKCDSELSAEEDVAL